MKRLLALLVAIVCANGCASDGSKTGWREAWKDLRGDNMKMQSSADLKGWDDR